MQNATFIPIIKALKAKFEANKEALVGFFPKNVIDRACYEYAQQQFQQYPFMLLPTEDAVAFYRPLADLKQLKAIIFEQEKMRFSKDLLILIGDNIEQAKTCLHRFRLSRLKNGYQPGIFSEHLRLNHLIPNEKTPNNPTKKARFA